MSKTTEGVVSSIAREYLDLELADSVNRAESELCKVSILNLKKSLVAAFDAGVKSGIAQELGMSVIVHDSSLDQFPWQVHMSDGRMTYLFTADFSRYAHVLSGIRTLEGGRGTVTMDRVPTALLNAVRIARANARSR